MTYFPKEFHYIDVFVHRQRSVAEKYHKTHEWHEYGCALAVDRCALGALRTYTVGALI